MKAKIATCAALAAAMTVSTAANANFLDKVSGALGKVNNVLGAVAGAQSSNSNSGVIRSAPMAKITDEQKQIIQNSIQGNTDDRFLNQYIVEAKDNIAQALEVLACQYEGDTPALGRVAASGANVMFQTVIPRTKYHPLDQCMTVSSVGRWSAPVRDKLQFHAYFVSDVSGESRNKYIEMTKENGKWLVSHIMTM